MEPSNPGVERKYFVLWSFYIIFSKELWIFFQLLLFIFAFKVIRLAYTSTLFSDETSTQCLFLLIGSSFPFKLEVGLNILVELNCFVQIIFPTFVNLHRNLFSTLNTGQVAVRPVPRS